MQRLKRFFTKGDFIRGLVADIRANRFAPSIIRHFDWPLFLAIICLAAFGIVSIFRNHSGNGCRDQYCV